MKKRRGQDKARPVWGGHIGSILKNKPKDQGDPLVFDRSVKQKVRRESREARRSFKP